ncbi:MAG TPA: potassium transporter TrkG [Mariprofundaceae bacterium]|nr:potassium transporter TrkG [Mariprofundaceae bacterium]
MTEGASSLTYAVRPAVLGKYLGQLGLMLALLTVVPFVASLIFGEYAFSHRYLAVIAVLLLVAVPLSRLPTPERVQLNEALVITALAFAIAPLLMIYPMMGAGLTAMDALFEAVSAVTTTGLSTLTSVEGMPHTFLFARAWMQWYGGLGIVVLSIALLMGHHITARQLSESVGSDNLATTARTHARRMLIVYLGLTLFGIVLLWLLIDNGELALDFILSAVSTGGFAPLDRSLAGLDSEGGHAVVTLFSLAGALPLVLYYRLWNRDWRAVATDLELRALVAACLFFALILTLLFHTMHGFGWAQSIRHGLLLGISAQTTTGFSTLDISGLGNMFLGVLIAAMAVGGGIGSTAGGFKILRLLILLRLLQMVLRRSSMPSHAVIEPKLGGRVLEDDDIVQALFIILLFALVVFFSWLLFLYFGYAPLRALFEVVSATGTVGLSTGISGPALPSPLKLLLCADMLLGRIDIVALLVVLYPPTWIGRRVEA